MGGGEIEALGVDTEQQVFVDRGWGWLLPSAGSSAQGGAGSQISAETHPWLDLCVMALSWLM